MKGGTAAIAEYSRVFTDKCCAQDRKDGEQCLGWIKLKKGTTKPEAAVCWGGQGNAWTIILLKMITKYPLVYGTVHEWVYLGNL